MGQFLHKYNTDNVHTRAVIVGLINLLNSRIQYENVLSDTVIETIGVPFLPNMGGDERFLQDFFTHWNDCKHPRMADGNYDVSVLGAQTANDNPMAASLVSWATDNGISQAQFDDLASKLRSTAESVMSSDMVDPKVEMEKLGPNGQAMVKDMVDWGRGLVKKGIWSPDEFEEFKIMGGTATGLRALMKVRETYEGRVPIQSVPSAGTPSKEELQAMVGDPKYQSDPAYRQKVERLFHQAFG